jgi:hypothetical protein
MSWDRKYISTAWCITFALFIASSATQAAPITLTSPDGRWSFAPTEFGDFGGTSSPTSFGRRDFGNGLGLADFAWGHSVLAISGSNRQWMSASGAFGRAQLQGSPLTTTISDSTVANVRTSVFALPGFSNVTVTLAQAATNDGLFQQYAFANSGAVPVNLRLVRAADIDLDYGSYVNNRVTAVGRSLRVSEGTRMVPFDALNGASTAYVAVHRGFIGVTPGVFAVPYNGFGIPAGDVDSFRFLSSSNISATLVGNADVNNDKVSDEVQDVGFLMQYELTIPAGSAAGITLVTGLVPEPSTLLLGALAGVGLLRWRRRCRHVAFAVRPLR